MSTLPSPSSSQTSALSPDTAHRYLGDGLLDEHEEVPPRLSLAAFLAIFLAIAFIFWLGAHAGQRASKPAPIGPFGAGSESAAASKVIVHVAGAVNKPGVYEFAPDARVRDAVQKAGGPQGDAEVNNINLAAYLEDGQRIEVPRKPKAVAVAAAELPRASESPIETELPEYSAPAFTPALPRDDSFSTAPRESRPQTPTKITAKPKVLPEIPRETTAKGEESQNADPEYFERNPLNLNRATAQQLELLPGIGPSTAGKILAARKEKGGFKSVDDLDEVPGIGEKTLEKLRPLVTVD